MLMTPQEEAKLLRAMRENRDSYSTHESDGSIHARCAPSAPGSPSPCYGYDDPWSPICSFCCCFLPGLLIIGYIILLLPGCVRHPEPDFLQWRRRV